MAEPTEQTYYAAVWYFPEVGSGASEASIAGGSKVALQVYNEETGVTADLTGKTIVATSNQTGDTLGSFSVDPDDNTIAYFHAPNVDDLFIVSFNASEFPGTNPVFSWPLYGSIHKVTKIDNQAVPRPILDRGYELDLLDLDHETYYPVRLIPSPNLHVPLECTVSASVSAEYDYIHDSISFFISPNLYSSNHTVQNLDDYNSGSGLPTFPIIGSVASAEVSYGPYTVHLTAIEHVIYVRGGNIYWFETNAKVIPILGGGNFYGGAYSVFPLPVEVAVESPGSISQFANINIWYNGLEPLDLETTDTEKNGLYAPTMTTGTIYATEVRAGSITDYSDSPATSRDWHEVAYTRLSSDETSGATTHLNTTVPMTCRGANYEYRVTFTAEILEIVSGGPYFKIQTAVDGTWRTDNFYSFTRTVGSTSTSSSGTNLCTGFSIICTAAHESATGEVVIGRCTSTHWTVRAHAGGVGNGQPQYCIGGGRIQAGGSITGFRLSTEASVKLKSGARLVIEARYVGP